MTAVLVLLSSLGAPPAASPAPGPRPLVVMTYNIHHGEGLDGVLDLDRIASIICDVNPDVACLQELDRNLPRTGHRDLPALLAEKLGMQAVFEPNYRFDGGEYGNATLTRLPVLASSNTALPNPEGKEPRGCLSVTVEWQGIAVEILNTHLGLTGLERLAQAEAIAALPKSKPRILAGDMNETSTAPGMQRLTALMKAGVDLEAQPPEGTVPSDAPRRRIDHILADDSLEILSSRVIRTAATQTASDHLPCVASFQQKKARGAAE